MAYSLIDPDIMLILSCRLLGLWGLLNALQWLASLRHWKHGSALGWDLQRLRASRLFGSDLFKRLFAPLPMLGTMVCLLVASALLLIASDVWLMSAALAVLAFTTSLLNLRSVADGADKMAIVVTWGLLLQSFGALVSQPALVLAGIFWVGGQLTISYATSGAGKLFLWNWRTGDVLRKTLSSYFYGHKVAHAFASHRTAAKLFAWLLILIELLFPLAILAPLSLLLLVLGCLFAFHLATAFVMGLNTYPVAFVAAYPSVLLLAQWLHGLMGR